MSLPRLVLSPAFFKVHLVGIAVALCSFSPPATASPKVRVQGTVKILASAVPIQDRTEVRGTVIDDAGKPVASASVTLGLLDRGKLLRFSAETNCEGAATGTLGEIPGRQEWVVVSRADGAFCARLERDITGNIQLKVLPSTWLSGATAEVAIDRTRRSLELSLSASSERLDLSRPAHILQLDTRVIPQFLADDAVREIRLQLASQGQSSTQKLADVSAHPNEREEIELLSKDLGEPGSRELSVSYVGSAWLKPATAVLQVELVAPVSIDVERLGAAEPGEPFRPTVNVTSRFGRVMNGAIEASVDGKTLSVAPVENGTALPTLLLDGPAKKALRIRYTFVPATPYFLPGLPAEQTVTLHRASELSALPWVLGALIAAGWILTAWWRPRGRTQQLPPAAAEHEAAGPGLELIRTTTPEDGWVGRVLDVHTGDPIGNASITLRAPTFSGTGVLALTTTDAEGAFRLDALPGEPSGVAISLTAPWHLPLVQPLPANGEVIIRLVSRRRSLIEGLVLWSQRRGRPWNRPGDPTPGHVARIADRHLAPDVAAWAESIESAAFGPVPVDEKAEAKVRAGEPRS